MTACAQALHVVEKLGGCLGSMLPFEADDSLGHLFPLS